VSNNILIYESGRIFEETLVE